MLVIVDSGAFIKNDWHAHRPAATALLAAARRGAITLAVPEIVLREVINKHRELELEAIEHWQQAQSDLRRLQGSRCAIAVDPPPDSANDGYETDLRTKLERSGARIPALPQISHDELAARALARRRPFDQEGQKGYRDALIWHNVLDEIAVGRHEDVVLVSRNPRDFADHPEHQDALHPHLVEEVQALGVDPGRFRITLSFEAAVKLVLAPAEEAKKALAERLITDDEFRNELEGQMEAIALGALDVDDSMIDWDLDPKWDGFADSVTDYRLESLEDLSGASVDEVRPLGGNEHIVEFVASAEATFEAEIDTSVFGRSPDAVPRDIELSGDERVAYASGWASVNVHFEAIYNAETGELGEIDATLLSPA